MDGKNPLSAIISSGITKIAKVGFKYKDNGIVTAGGKGGKENVYEFKDGEYITKMTVCKGRKNLISPYYISYIKFTTNLNNTISAGKYNLYNEKTFEAPKGYSIAGFIGYSNDAINKLGCVYQKI